MPYPDNDLPGWWHSQVGQDHSIMALFANATAQPRNRYFVDLASSQPVVLSNTRALERDYEWRGLCIEGNRALAQALAQRRQCTTVEAIVTDSERSIEFHITKDSTVAQAKADSDCSTAKRRCRQATTLAAILERHQAPATIDYLSLDAEGQEANILLSFPFERCTFLTLTVERPPQALRDVLSKQGYTYAFNHGWFGDELWLHASFPGGVAPGIAVARRAYQAWNRAMRSPEWTLHRRGPMNMRYLRQNNCGIPAAWVEHGLPPYNRTHPVEVLDAKPPCPTAT